MSDINEESTSYIPEDMFNPESVDLSAPIYATSPESQVQPSVFRDEGSDESDEQAMDVDLFDLIHRLENKIDAQGKTVDGLRDGVNTIGEMMNSVAETFDQIMQKIQQGGITSLLGGLMGGKNNG